MSQDPTALAAEVVSAFNDGDWKRFRAVVGEDIVYNEAGTGRRLVGMDAYLDALESWRKTFSDVRGTIEEVVADGGTVVQRITWRGTHTGPLELPTGTVPASGHSIELVASLWHHVEDGKVREIHNHLDVLTMLTQLGIVG